jgi:hypothetical protein
LNEIQVKDRLPYSSADYGIPYGPSLVKKNPGGSDGITLRSRF